MTETNCGHMQRHRQNDWGSVRYDAKFDEYWFQAGGARQLLFYCPWCGERLPPSQRDRRFDELEGRGMPAEFQSGEWRGTLEPTDLGPQRGGAIEGRVLNLFDVESDES